MHKRRKVLNIEGGGGGGGARFRKLGGGVGQGWAILFSRCKLTGASAPIQCQIIIFFTLKTDNIAKLRISLKSILLEIHSYLVI